MKKLVKKYQNPFSSLQIPFNKQRTNKQSRSFETSNFGAFLTKKKQEDEERIRRKKQELNSIQNTPFGRRFKSTSDKSRILTEQHYNSRDYYDRVKRAGLKDSNFIGKMVDTVRDIPILLTNNEEISELSSSSNVPAETDSSNVLAITGKITPSIEVNRDAYDGSRGLISSLKRKTSDMFSTITHELSHAADSNLPKDALEYNNKLIEGNINEGLDPYYTSPTEIRARGMDIIISAKNKGMSVDDYLNEYSDDQAVRDFNKIFKTPSAMKNYLKNFVSNDSTQFNPEDVLYARRGKKLIPKKFFNR